MPPLHTVPIIQVPNGVAIPAQPTISVDTAGNYIGPGFPAVEVPASQTGFPLGRNGAAGDYVDRILIVPASTSPGAVTLVDGETEIPVFAGGADSVSDLRPFVLALGYASAEGGWTLTTEANVSAVVNGRFTDDPPEGMAWVVDENGDFVTIGNDYLYTEGDMGTISLTAALAALDVECASLTTTNGITAGDGLTVTAGDIALAAADAVITIDGEQVVPAP